MYVVEAVGPRSVRFPSTRTIDSGVWRYASTCVRPSRTYHAESSGAASIGSSAHRIASGFPSRRRRREGESRFLSGPRVSAARCRRSDCGGRNVRSLGYQAHPPGSSAVTSGRGGQRPSNRSGRSRRRDSQLAPVASVARKYSNTGATRVRDESLTPMPSVFH